MARAQFDDVETFCVVCKENVPIDRVKHKAITCSPTCATLRKNSIRSKQDARECRYCRKPSTPEDRNAFQRFRRMEAKRPDLLYPSEYAAWKNEQLEWAKLEGRPDADTTPAGFAQVVRQGHYARVKSMPAPPEREEERP